MTWHTFFNLSTLEHRHLLAAYATVFIVQGSYVLWILRGWLRSKGPRE